MKILKWSKDGGLDSPVDGFFIVEIKPLFSVVLLRFNRGGREAYHTHAFHALTWFISGDLIEQDIDGSTYRYKRSLLPKCTRRSKNHRVIADSTSWCFSIRGPWQKTWTESINGESIVLTHGRKRVE